MALRLRPRSSRVLCVLGATTILTPFALPGVAAAQDTTSLQLASAADQPSSPPPAETGIGDIVVTATRSAQSVQRVPISIQALSAEKLEQRQIVSFADYANLLPSVSFSTLGPGRSSAFFRGISSSSGNAATVGTYLDEVPITTSGRMPEVHMYDMERIEALAGPQGTLFGASSLSGTLRLITKKPNKDKFEAGYDLQGNKYGDGNFGGMAEAFMNVPISDHVAIRIMGFYRHDGGYIDNTPGSLTYKLGDGETIIDSYHKDNKSLVKDNYNSITEYGYRFTGSVDLNDSWTVTPQITGQYQNSYGSFNYDPRVGDLQVHDYSPTYNKDEWYQAALTINGKIADFDIVSATGYFKRRIRNANDYTYYTVTYDNFGPGYENYLKFKDANGNFLDPTQRYYGDLQQQKFTQELRVSVPKSWPFSLTVGGFYQWQLSENNGDYLIPGLGAASTLPANIAAGTNVAVKRDAFYLVENNTTFKDWAVFAEGSVDILTNLKLTGGIRGFRTRSLVYGFAGVQGSARRAYDTLTGQTGCALPLPAEQRLTCINNNIYYNETGETHKLSLTWQVTPSKMVYATYSTGFRPGGGNRIAPNNPYKADTLSNYELGFKTSWGGRFRLNGAVYYEEWDGIQYSVVPFGFQGAGLTVNAGKARVYGVELDGDLRLGPVTLSGSGAYNDAALSTDFCNLDPVLKVVQLASCSTSQVGSVAAAKGTRLPRQPRFKMQGSARYDFDVGEYRAFVQGVAFYQSSSTSNLDTYKNSLLGNTPGFASFDFSAGFRKDGWTVEAFIQNAFDRRGQLSKNTFCSIEYCAGSSRTYPIKPQFFGVKVGQRF